MRHAALVVIFKPHLNVVSQAYVEVLGITFALEDVHVFH
jgi:hypothetical protein